MAIKKHKPSLDGIIKRRKSTVAQYFSNLNIKSSEQLRIVLEALLGSYRISEQLQQDAFDWVATLEAAQKKSENPQLVSAENTLETDLEKPKKPQKRPPKRSPTKKRADSKKSKSEDNES